MPWNDANFGIGTLGRGQTYNKECDGKSAEGSRAEDCGGIGGARRLCRSQQGRRQQNAARANDQDDNRRHVNSSALEGLTMPETPTVIRAAQSKRLAVFLDGTWNVVGDDTNVWRMKALCAPENSGGTAQLTYYEPAGSRCAAV